jgi:HNH endonuclease
MPLRAPNFDPGVILAAVALVLITFYFYQVASRKREWLRYKLKTLLVSELSFIVAAYVLAQQRLPVAEVMVFSILIGLGCGYVLVRRPSANRRIPKSLRAQVIARDLTSKGLKWDAAKHHIDHIVPYSRGGDHSLRNLRVTEKERNLRKGGKMPRLRDFFSK